jgi:hypothetical protein
MREAGRYLQYPPGIKGRAYTQRIKHQNKQRPRLYKGATCMGTPPINTHALACACAMCLLGAGAVSAALCLALRPAATRSPQGVFCFCGCCSAEATSALLPCCQLPVASHHTPASRGAGKKGGGMQKYTVRFPCLRMPMAGSPNVLNR